MNHYSISCGEEETRKISREIMFKVVKDESRSMEPV
jgi:hypothetical protein